MRAACASSFQQSGLSRAVASDQASLNLGEGGGRRGREERGGEGREGEERGGGKGRRGREGGGRGKGGGDIIIRYSILRILPLQHDAPLH